MKLVLISYPENFKHEHELLIRLFEEGLEYFHLRKHGFSKGRLEKYLNKIPKEYHDKVIIYDHYDLVDTYKLKGIHFNAKTKHKIGNYKYLKCHKSYSAHTFDEIQAVEYPMDYVLISPVFDSISKNGYQQKVGPDAIQEFYNSNTPAHPIVALGGINEYNIDQLQDIGLEGVALLGNVWNSYFETKNIDFVVDKYKKVKRKTMSARPKVLSVAGFDPSSGAGITADVKTFENNEVYGFGVCSAITYQNESEFESVDWLCMGKIKQQMDLLLKKHCFGVMKIGIIESIETLSGVIHHMKKANQETKIIWDPVLKTSSGFNIHKEIDNYSLFEILKSINLVTPNLDEAEILFGTKEPQSIQQLVKEFGLCSVLLKGGHSSDNSTDYLITNTNIYSFEGENFEGMEKHGTGCVLSSSIASFLARRTDMVVACRKAKKYTEKFIQSNNLTLGYHNCYE